MGSAIKKEKGFFSFIWIIGIALLPSFVSISVSKEVNSFSLIDALSLSFFIAALAVLTSLLRLSFAFLFVVFSAIFITVFIVVSNQYYLFYGSLVTYETLLLFNDLILAINQFVPPIAAFIAIVVIFLFMLFILNVNGKAPFRSTLVVLSLLVLSSLSLGVFHKKNNDLVNALRPLESGHLVLNEQNPAMYFLRSTPLWSILVSSEKETIEVQNFKNLAANIKNNANIELPARYDSENFKHILNTYPSYKTTESPTHPWYNIPLSSRASAPSISKKNVILIVLESVRAYETAIFNPSYSLTPNLDKISKLGLTAPFFYANNRQTVKAEQALLCSAIDYSDNAPYSIKYGNFNSPCLPDILKENSYDTLWFHGYTKSFFNRNEYLPSLGYDTLYAKEEFTSEGYDSSNDIGWGVPDSTVFSTALEKLENRSSQKPFFAEILTLTNHQPFDWNFGDVPIATTQHENSNTIYNNYRKGVAYTDKQLGHFWERFTVSPLAKNTIVVITADHGVPYYPDTMTSLAEQREVLFRLPLVVVSPERLYSGTIQEPLSQLDIAPTLLSILGISHSNSFVGRPFLGENATLETRPIFLRSSDGLSFRYGQLKCDPTEAICTQSKTPCTAIERLYCTSDDSSLFPLAHEALRYNEFLDLALETGFAFKLETSSVSATKSIFH